MPPVSRHRGFLRAALLLILGLYSQTYECCSQETRPWKTQRVVTTECYYAQSNATRKNVNLQPEEIRFEVKNKSDGTIQVQFPVENDEIVSYDISLYVNEEAATSENCGGFGNTDISTNCKKHFHSVHQFYNSACENVEKQESCNPSCDLRGSVTFKNVYSGCYVVVIDAYTEDDLSERPVYSVGRLLETDYKKNPVWKMAPTIGEQINLSSLDAEDSVVTVIITKLAWLFHERLLVELFLQNYTNCYFNHGGQFNDIAAWTLALSDKNELVWAKQTDTPFLQNCWEEKEDVKCKFTNMKPGNYCLGLQPDHPDQCRDSVWTYDSGSFNTCHYERHFAVTFNLPDAPPGVILEDGGGVTIISIAIVFSIVGLLAICCIIHFYRRSAMQPLLSSSVTSEKGGGQALSCTISGQPRVLLLYAQDCEEFMNLMAVFRELLEVVGKCEVLDCFDHERIDVAACPGAWIRYWAGRSDTKVVVVASPCAMVHQQTMSQNITLYYKVPINYSDLFRMGLREVMHNKERKYWNTFVVRFDNSDLDHVMPYTRYMLPPAVNDLLQDLNMHADLKNLPDSFIMKKLEHEYNKLLDHYRRQPDYVSRLLFKLKEAV